MANRKYTTDQVQRRRAAVLDLWIKGHGVEQIRRAIGVKFASTVSDDLRIMLPGRELRRKRVTSLTRPEPEPVNWLDPPPLPPSDERVIRAVRGFLAEIKGMNYRNVLAHEAISSLVNGNPHRVEEIRKLGYDLEAAASAIIAIAVDPGYRDVMATTAAGRDDLRNVNGLTVHDVAAVKLAADPKERT